jgi:hypothetical protein
MDAEATFEAVDQDGNRYKIHVRKSAHDVSDLHRGRAVTNDTAGELWTDTGLFVNYVERGIYDIVDGAEVIRISSADPSAP